MWHYREFKTYLEKENPKQLVKRVLSLTEKHISGPVNLGHFQIILTSTAPCNLYMEIPMRGNNNGVENVPTPCFYPAPCNKC